MANVTVSIPEELKKRMERVHGVNWSEVARKAFEDAVKQSNMLEAARAMDELRHSRQASNWSGVKEIRKWRYSTKS